MERNLPGTAIEVQSFRIDGAGEILSYIFASGGIVLGQICAMTGLEPYMVQNWVKRGFVPKPQRKTYDKDQFCRIVIIHMLRDSLQIDEITGLLSYINGALDDTSDDRIGDAQLYNLFVNLIATLGGATSGDAIAKAIASILPSDMDPTTIRYVRDVLRIMAYAYFSTTFNRQAKQDLQGLDR